MLYTMVTQIKKTRGRQRVPMEKMKKDSNRLVTFSKRRSGLFKKASELCTLTDAQVGIVVFSPAQKLHSFGHPSVNTIIDRYIYEDGSQGNPLQYRGPHEILQDTNIMNSNKELTDLKDKHDNEKKRSDEILNERKSKSEEALKFLAPVEGFTPEELKQMLSTLIRLRDTVQNHQQGMDEAYNLNTNSNPIPNPMCQTINYPLHMVSNPQTFGGPSQMTMARGPYDNPPIVMIPTPTQSMAMMPSGIGMQPHDGFNHANMMQPFQGTINPVPIQGQFDGRQTMTTNMGMDPIPGTYQGFTSLLMGGGRETSQAPPFNPQGGFRFGPGPN